MTKRYIVRVELRKGYQPCISIKRAPYAGQQIKNGHFPGTLKTCQLCSGEGYLIELDNVPQTVSPESE
jgi:hypothetical protein